MACNFRLSELSQPWHNMKWLLFFISVKVLQSPEARNSSRGQMNHASGRANWLQSGTRSARGGVSSPSPVHLMDWCHSSETCSMPSGGQHQRGKLSVTGDFVILFTAWSGLGLWILGDGSLVCQADCSRNSFRRSLVSMNVFLNVLPLLLVPCETSPH